MWLRGGSSHPLVPVELSLKHTCSMYKLQSHTHTHASYHTSGFLAASAGACRYFVSCSSPHCCTCAGVVSDLETSGAGSCQRHVPMLSLSLSFAFFKIHSCTHFLLLTVEMLMIPSQRQYLHQACVFRMRIRTKSKRQTYIFLIRP